MKVGIGFNINMLLVVGLICLTIYVFFVSKDILSLDKEIKALKNQLNIVMNSTLKGPSVQPPHMGVMMQPQHIILGQQARGLPQDAEQDEYESESDGDVIEADDGVDSEEIKNMLSSIQEGDETVEDDAEAEVETEAENIQEGEPAEEPVVQETTPTSQINVEELKQMKYDDLKMLCKAKGISIRGGREQLIEKIISS